MIVYGGHMSATSEARPELAKTDLPVFNAASALNFLIEIASASDAELRGILQDTMTRLCATLGAVRVQLFRTDSDKSLALEFDATLPLHSLHQKVGLPSPLNVQDLFTALQPNAPERFAKLASIKGSPDQAILWGASFGTEKGCGVVVFYTLGTGTPFAEIDSTILMPIFGGLSSFLRRTDGTALETTLPTLADHQGDIPMLTAFDAMADGIAIFGADNRLLVGNRLYHEMGRANPHLFPQNPPQPSQPGQTLQDYTLADGRVFRMAQSLMPDGNTLQVHSDVTPLWEAEQRLRYLVDGAGVCTWEWDVKTGQHRVNAYWATLLGYTLEELSPVTFNTWRERVHPDDLAATEALFDKAVTDDKVVYLAEYRLRHKMGHWVWVLDTGRTLHRGASGTPELIAGMQVDISEQKAREAALIVVKAKLERSISERAKVEQRLADIATVSDGWLWEMDSSCRYSLVLDGEFFDDGGVPREGLLGLTQAEWLDTHPNMRPGIDWDSFLALLEANQPFRDFIYRAPQSGDGVIRWRRMTGTPIHDASGAFMGYRGVGSDITELYQARAGAEEASHAKSMFLATMSHEIRTPLNGVLGMAEVMDNALSDPAHKRMIRTIRRSGESLLNILNDILDLSKIEAGKLELESVPFRLQDLAEQVQDLHSQRADEKHLEFDVLIGGGSDLQFLGDPYRVQQILHNLVSNSIKFTDQGEVEVKLSGRSGSPLLIEVRDTGIGMTPAQLGRLHDEYSQADVSVTRRFGGTGLGMAITRTLIESMGGTIRVISAFGEGTTTQVSLPLPISDGLFKPVADDPELPISLNGVRVLAADDNATNRAVLDAMLTRRGAEVVLVSDGELAFHAWSTGAFDVVLLDIAMPVMDGPTALGKIRDMERQAGRKAVPVIAVTANVMAHQISEYLTMGFDLCVAKPLDSGKLALAITSLLAIN